MHLGDVVLKYLTRRTTYSHTKRSHSTSSRKLPLILECIDQCHSITPLWIHPLCSIHYLILHIIIFNLPRSLCTDVSPSYNVDIECRSLGCSCTPTSRCTDFPLALSQRVNPFSLFVVIDMLHLKCPLFQKRDAMYD